MAIDEAARLRLYEHVRAAFDEDAADTLMNALPRDPDRFATKDDVSLVRGDLAAVEATLRGEIKAANSELLRTLFFGMVATNATLVGLVFAAVRLG
jgi:hypothetical protein